MLATYVNSRLIPLDKSPGVRPIGIGEVLRRIIGKSISRHATNEIKEAAGPLQTCASHGAGAEAAIHAMRKTFEMEGTGGWKAVFLPVVYDMEKTICSYT